MIPKLFGCFPKLILALILFGSSVSLVNAQGEFITEWDLSKTGTGSTQIKFDVTKGSGGNITYSWRELPEPGVSGSGTINASGTFTLTGLPLGKKIELKLGSANLERFAIGKSDDKNRLIKVTQWGTASWTSFADAFKECRYLDVTALDVPNLTNVTDLSNMFYECNFAFKGNSTFNSWNTSNVTDMSGMFSWARPFNQPIGNWNTSNVTNMQGMFYGASDFNQPIGNWNTSNVTNMGQMFQNTRFNQPIGNWDVSKVTDMSNMFNGAQAFNQPIGGWNTSSVTNMDDMFGNTTSFNQPIGDWNTSNVTTMGRMFINAKAFNNPSPGNWTLKSIVGSSPYFSRDLPAMFTDSGLDCNSYGLILRGWANNPNTTSGLILGALNIKYGAAYSGDRSTLITSKGWKINDGGEATSCAPLPVSFDNIEAYAKDGILYVNWATMNEKNIAKFEIEGSKDSVSFFKIGEVISKAKDGTSANKLSYSFSLSVNGITTAGFALLGLAIGAALMRKRKLTLIIFSMLIFILSFSCSKKKKEIFQINDYQYVHIVMVSKDAVKTYSKVVKVESRQ